MGKNKKKFELKGKVIEKNIPYRKGDVLYFLSNDLYDNLEQYGGFSDPYIRWTLNLQKVKVLGFQLVGFTVDEDSKGDITFESSDIMINLKNIKRGNDFLDALNKSSLFFFSKDEMLERFTSYEKFTEIIPEEVKNQHDRVSEVVTKHDSDIVYELPSKEFSRDEILKKMHKEFIKYVKTLND